MKQIFFAAALLLSTFTNAQECSEKSAHEYQQQLNKEYADPKESPLTKQDIKTFTALDFYPVDMDYCVEAKLVRTPNEKPFIMPTTGNFRPTYVKYGELYFELMGREYKLDVFQNLDLVKKEEYKDNLFLPFTDLTSGDGSYGGGRYIDLNQPEGNVIVIDFNKSYNPYCAYNPVYMSHTAASK